MVSLNQYLKDVHARGVRVGEHPDYGGVNNALHMKGSQHAKGNAGDLNYGPRGDSAEEREMLRWAARLADAADLNVIYAHHRTHPNPRTNAAHRGHLHVDGQRPQAYRSPHPGGDLALYRKIRAEVPVGGPGEKRKPHRITTIKRGVRDDWRVKLWQEFLKATGDYKGKIDGDFGPATEAATKVWQRRAKLEDDGVVGKNTWYRATQGVVPGKRGVRVEIAQRMLGLTGGDVDGIAGKIYIERAKEVQRWLGVVPDAKIGGATVGNLLKKG
jgi:peptidoglycan hydrolase-like protein with peptidoglycan-binding domain